MYHFPNCPDPCLKNGLFERPYLFDTRTTHTISFGFQLITNFYLLLLLLCSSDTFWYCWMISISSKNNLFTFQNAWAVMLTTHSCFCWWKKWERNKLTNLFSGKFVSNPFVFGNFWQLLNNDTTLLYIVNLALIKTIKMRVEPNWWEPK